MCLASPRMPTLQVFIWTRIYVSLMAGYSADQTRYCVFQHVLPCDFPPGLHILQIQREESNFVYGDYKLIVELSHDAHWFWDATKDAHGTTSNKLAMSKPDRWKKYIAGQPNAAQWTCAQTIPYAVASSASNSKQPKTDTSLW
jgi:hypothetical protein